MVVLRGAKTFNLLPPSMSRNVYGGEPIRAAHYTVEVTPTHTLARMLMLTHVD